MSLSEPNLARRGLLKAGAVLALTACAPGLAPPPRRPVPAAGLDPFVGDDATALAERVRQRELTPLELLDVVIHRIEALDGDLNAVTTRTFERARIGAAGPTADAPFAGVPFLMKDMIDCAGVPRTDGAHEIFGRTPTSSPAYMDAVEGAGFNIVGVTNVPEFATLPTTVNERFGATRNPWDLTRTPAGSSGGSAAAVAAGLVPMAHATDGAGSIRLPSSYCGVFGFKPSRGRTVSGEMDGGHDLLKHHHAISRSVRDSATLLQLTEDAGSGARYATVGRVVEANAKRRTIALDPGGLAGIEPDSETRKALEHTASLLSGMGHHVLELPPTTIEADKFWRHLESVFMARMPSLVALTERLTGKAFDETDVLSPFTMSLARLSLAQSPNAAARAEAYFAQTEQVLSESLEGIDAVLSPVQPTVPPRIDVFSPDSTWETEVESMRAFLNYTAVANVSGAPAMSVPLYWTEAHKGAPSVPLGTQLMAKPGEDRLLLELAFELEAAEPWRDRWPPLSVRFPPAVQRGFDSTLDV